MRRNTDELRDVIVSHLRDRLREDIERENRRFKRIVVIMLALSTLAWRFL